MLFFSVSTSPLYADYYSYGGMMDGGDSLQLETIGKAWTEGLITEESIGYEGIMKMKDVFRLCL